MSQTILPRRRKTCISGSRTVPHCVSSGGGTNNLAKFAAAYHALRSAVTPGLTHLDNYTDPQFVVGCVTSCSETSHPQLRPYPYAICEVLQLLSCSLLTAWKIGHLHREANSVADALATEGKARAGFPSLGAPALPSPEVAASTACMHSHLLYMHNSVGRGHNHDRPALPPLALECRPQHNPTPPAGAAPAKSENFGIIAADQSALGGPPVTSSGK
jgi:ribonuclease HI